MTTDLPGNFWSGGKGKPSSPGFTHEGFGQALSRRADRAGEIGRLRMRWD
ncbi:MAG: hypothetical protein N3A38_02545 [Planctomycetota bacterium]|nr:hypothetical protein [Planctomycetota bacterium]